MNIYLQIIITIGVIGLSAGNFFANFGKGKRGSTLEMIEFYQKEVVLYKDMMIKKEDAHIAKIEEITKNFTGKINDLTREVGEVRGELNAERKLREQAENILKDKNPETQDFMKFMVDTQKEVVTILKEIHEMSKAEADREIVVETTSSVTKTP